MSKTKRKRYSSAFKVKVGLEALMGVKTVGQIAREYQVHPAQVTQWKGVLRDHLPDLFESPQAAAQDQEQWVAHLHEKIGQLSVELDWLNAGWEGIFAVDRDPGGRNTPPPMQRRGELLSTGGAAQCPACLFGQSTTAPEPIFL